MIVVLPAIFTGGATHLAHGSLSAVYDCSAASLSGTTVIAWSTGVTYELKPITSGHRLVLAYKLVQPRSAPVLSLSDSENMIQRLRHVLRSWISDGGASAPDKIIYLLTHNYCDISPTASALRGEDANKVSMLRKLCEELGFGLALATVELYVYGYADRHYDSDVDEDNISFGEVEGRNMDVMDIVDLDGEAVANELTVDRTRDTIPWNLDKLVESGDHDDQSYEEPTGHVSGPMLLRSSALSSYHD